MKDIFILNLSQSCFSGGMFGLGALTYRRGNWTTHLDVGKNITETCYRSYELSSTGLGSESILTDTLTSSGYESYLLRCVTCKCSDVPF